MRDVCRGGRGFLLLLHPPHLNLSQSPTHPTPSCPGPSGAGKTTLLDVLTRRKTIGCVEGSVTYNGVAVASAPDLQAHAAYVVQEESFHATSTVMEAVLFRAHMRMPRSVPTAAKRAEAERLLERAGLQGKEDMRIGGQLPGGFLVRGLSGGEKRRLSLCCGVVGSPAVLICDEVTSGTSACNTRSKRQKQEKTHPPSPLHLASYRPRQHWCAQHQQPAS